MGKEKRRREKLIKEYRRLWKLKNAVNIYERGNLILKELKQIGG